jgi:hypothetical protein
MNQLILLLIACLFLFLALGSPPLRSFSQQAVGIITYAECEKRPNGQYACDLRVSYNPNTYTLLNDVPVKTLSSTAYTFGETPTVYFNPSNPKQLSVQRHVATSSWNLLFIVAALATLLLANKNT